jgi:hypothetical protein
VFDHTVGCCNLSNDKLRLAQSSFIRAPKGYYRLELRDLIKNGSFDLLRDFSAARQLERESFLAQQFWLQEREGIQA